MEDPLPHGHRFSKCAGCGVKEEKSRATVRRAFPQRVSRVSIEYEGHTSSYSSLLADSNCLSQQSLKTPGTSIPPATTSVDPLTASPCHLGMSDLPDRS